MYQPTPTYGRPSPLDDLTLTQAVDLLYAAAEKLSETAVYDTVRHTDLETSLRLLDRLRAALRLARDADDALVQNAYRKGRGDHVIEGLGPVTVSRTQDRKAWDERGIAQAVLDAHLSGGDGVVPEPWTVVSWLFEVIHVDYARLGALRALGLDPDDYSTRVRGRPSVRLPSGR